MNPTIRSTAGWSMVAIAMLVLMTGAWLRCSSPVVLAQGIFWQPDSQHLHPHGVWNEIGVSSLVVQYGSVDQRAWFSNAYQATYDDIPDWKRIGGEPWARRVVMGMAGSFSEDVSRAHVLDLGRMSSLLAQRTPLPASAYYFPVEADPSWTGVGSLGVALESLPRPLWVSIYSRPINPQTLAAWVQTWLPPDVGVMLQDGVGVGDRNPEQAQALFTALQGKLGSRRVIMVAETFHQDKQGDLQAASFSQLVTQLKTYRGDCIYLYDASHLSPWKVWLLKLWFKLEPRG